MSVSALNSAPSFNFFNQFKNCLAHPLTKRVFSNNWQELLLLGGTVFAVVAAANAFFYGTVAMGVAFLVCAAFTTAGAFYLHKFAILKDLEITVGQLTQERQRLSALTENLGQENTRLSETNQELRTTSEALKTSLTQLEGVHGNFVATHTELQRTSADLQNTNTNLADQVNTLSAQIPPLREQVEHFTAQNGQLKTENETFARQNGELSSQIKSLSLQVKVFEVQVPALTAQVTLFKTQVTDLTKTLQQAMERFQSENTRLGTGVDGLQTGVGALQVQIQSSGELCKSITSSLTEHERSLAEQMTHLKELFGALTNKGGAIELLTQLNLLQNQIREGTKELTSIKSQYAAENARLQEVSSGLAQLRDQFGSTLLAMDSNNQTHGTHNTKLEEQVSRLSTLFISRQNVITT